MPGDRLAEHLRRLAEVKASPEGRVCWLCDWPIDTSLPPDRLTDPGYWLAYFDPPLGQGGSLRGLVGGVHRGCLFGITDNPSVAEFEFDPDPGLLPYQQRPRQRKPRQNLYRGRAGASVYQRKSKALKDSPEGQVCWLCGRPIDTSLPPSVSNDPLYWTVDHDPPLSEGGSLLEGMRPAHRGCNSSLGGRAGRAKQDERGR